MVKKLKTGYYSGMTHGKVVVNVYELKINQFKQFSTSSKKIFQFVIQNFAHDEITSWSYVGKEYRDVKKIFIVDLDEYFRDY